jgi:hypothetical protein
MLSIKMVLQCIEFRLLKCILQFLIILCLVVQVNFSVVTIVVSLCLVSVFILNWTTEY